MVPSDESTVNPKPLPSSLHIITTIHTSLLPHTPPPPPNQLQQQQQQQQPFNFPNLEIAAALAQEDERRKGKQKVVDDSDDYTAKYTTPFKSHYINNNPDLYSEDPFDLKGKKKLDDYIITIGSSSRSSESDNNQGKEELTELDFLNLDGYYLEPVDIDIDNDDDDDNVAADPVPDDLDLNRVYIDIDSGSDHDNDNDNVADPVTDDLERVYIDIDSDSDSDSDNDNDNVADDLVPDRVPARINLGVEYWKQNRKRQATHFARPSGECESLSSASVIQLEKEIDGPFSEALKAIQDRITKTTKTSEFVVSESVSGSKKRKIEEEGEGVKVWVPSLLELSLGALANHSDKIVSLDGVPDELRHRLSRLLCDSRKGDARFLDLLLSGSPTDIRLKDCSWLTEEQFKISFGKCDTSRLEVLQLDQCGRCISDYMILGTLVKSPSCLRRLINLSLTGACRLTDKGLHALVASTPVLRSINLSQCSLLTYTSLNILADTLGPVLKELYLDDCLLIDAPLIVLPLKRLKHVEVLSLAGIETVSDGFIKDYIIACGHKIKELVLKDCVKLTDASIKVIAEHCPGLQALDLMNLSKLTDFSIGYLTNSCRALHTLKLCRNPFSDEAIAAFLETTGESLTELSLNNIRKVDQQTALSLASHGKNLHTLDLSWCRNLTDYDLGFIVDSCSSLRLLKLFGCTQLTDVFLKRRLKPEIQTIGLKLSPLTQYARVSNPHHQGALRYSPIQ